MTAAPVIVECPTCHEQTEIGVMQGPNAYLAVRNMTTRCRECGAPIVFESAAWIGTVRVDPPPAADEAGLTIFMSPGLKG